MAPVGFLFLFSSWPERVFEVARRQRVSFLVQLAFDLLTAALLVVLVRAGVEPLVALSAVIAVACAYHLAYMTAAARVARLCLARFRPIIAEAAALGLAGALGTWAVREIAVDIRLVLAITGAGLLAYYSWMLPRVRRDLLATGGGP